MYMHIVYAHVHVYTMHVIRTCINSADEQYETKKDTFYNYQQLQLLCKPIFPCLHTIHIM